MAAICAGHSRALIVIVAHSFGRETAEKACAVLPQAQQLMLFDPVFYSGSVLEVPTVDAFDYYHRRFIGVEVRAVVMQAVQADLAEFRNATAQDSYRQSS